MAYTAVYSGSDLAPITFDIVGNFLAAFGSQAATIAILIVIGFVLGLVAVFFGKIMGLFHFGKHY